MRGVPADGRPELYPTPSRLIVTLLPSTTTGAACHENGDACGLVLCVCREKRLSHFVMRDGCRMKLQLVITLTLTV